MDRKKQLKRPPAPDVTRHLLPWFPADSFEFSLFSPGYVLQCLQLEPHHAADLCGVSVPTVRRWLSESPPVWFMPYILACSGFLLSPGWCGWRVADNRLHEPMSRRQTLTFDGLSQGDIRKLQIERMNSTTLQLKMADLTAENAQLKKFNQRPHRRPCVKPDNIIDFEAIKTKWRAKNA